MMLMGRSGDTFAELDKAIAQDPRTADSAPLLRLRCRAHLGVGHYEAAISDCERAAVLEDYWISYLWLTAAYGAMNEPGKAADAKAHLLKARPHFTIAGFKAMRPSDSPAYWEQMEMYVFPGLRKAGIPDE